MPALPLPSQLPRDTSTTQPEFFLNGTYIDSSFGSSHNVTTIGAPANAVIFEPNFDAGIDSGLTGAAYAGYSFNTRGELNGNTQMRLNWHSELQHPNNLFVGIANFSHNAWDWYTYLGGINTVIDLGAKYADCQSPDGTIFVVVLFIGHGSAALDNLLLGEPVFYISTYADPDNADTVLNTTIHAGLFVQGSTISHYDYDFEGDGIWDVQYSLDATIAHTYSVHGIYHPKVRGTTALSTTAVGTTTVYVTSPSNIGPTALLHPSVTTGDAPLAVVLDGGDSFDDDNPQSAIIKAEWDLDNDGNFERDTGTNLITATTLARSGVNTLRLRVTDNDLATSTTSVNVTVNGGWTFTNIPGSLSGYITENDRISLALIGPSQLPALVYVPSGGLGKAQYVPAATPDASSWSPHNFINVEAGSQDSPILADVGGYPAVVYENYDAGAADQYQLRYTRALNGAGSSWSPSVQIFGHYIGNFDFKIVDGKPAVAIGCNQLNPGLYYVRSSDTTGANWDSPLTLRDATYVTSFGVPKILSRPGLPPRVIAAAKYLDEFSGPGTWMYTATDNQGTSFLSGTRFWNNVSENFSFIEKAGRLMFALHGGDPDNNGVNFMNLADIEDAPLTTPLVLDSSSFSGFNNAIATINGYPVVAYSRQEAEPPFNSNAVNLYMVMAGSPHAASWGPETVISGDSPAGIEVNMITMANGYPLLVYSNSIDNTLIAARWVAP